MTVALTWGNAIASSFAVKIQMKGTFSYRKFFKILVDLVLFRCSLVALCVLVPEICSVSGKVMFSRSRSDVYFIP